LVSFLFLSSPCSTFMSFFKSRFHIWQKIGYLSFWVWLILLNIMTFSYTHFPTNVMILLFLVAE
jgi:hypothetical protein